MLEFAGRRSRQPVPSAADALYRAWSRRLRGEQQLVSSWPSNHQQRNANGDIVRIFFEPAIDRGAWPGPLQHVAAVEAVDHKSLPLVLDAAITRLPAFSGQLAGYASAVSATSVLPLRSAWSHLPLLGVAELDLGAPARNSAKGGIERG